MTKYEPTAADRAAYGRLMLVHPELRQECPCFTGAQVPCADLSLPKQRCALICICGGTGYVAPPPETWCGLLVALMIGDLYT